MQYTEYFNLAKPEGTDLVDIDVLNGNMILLDTIFEDIYSRLGPTPPGPTPPKQFELIRAEGEPVFAEGIELARNFNSTATMTVGDTYTVTLNSIGYEPTTETVTIMDLSQMCKGAYGFAVSGGIFVVMFNAYATPSGDILALTPKENSIVAGGGDNWTSVVAIPQLLVPFVVPMDKFETGTEGSDSFNYYYAGGSNLSTDNTYKITINTVAGNAYSVDFNMVNMDGFLGANIDMEGIVPSDFPIVNFYVLNNAGIDDTTGEFTSGTSFIISLSWSGGTLEDLKALISDFTIELSTT